MWLKSSNGPNAQPVTFKRWGRKSYSLFCVLHRQVKIAVLSVAYFVVVPVTATAQGRDTSSVKMEYDLEEIEVSAQRTPALYPEVARVLTVFTRSEIESAPVQSVQELLEYVAGADVRQRGAEGVQADVSIRGGTFDQLVILLNGINITDPQTGHHNLNLPVGIHLIEQIEILQGPAARIYGPNAFSGAVNIVTRKPDKKDVHLEASAGSFGLLNGGISGSFSTGKKLSHLVSADGKKSNGYIRNTDFNMSGIYYANRLNLNGKGHVDTQLGFSGKAFGANSFYTPKYPNQFEQTRTLFGSVSAQLGKKYHLSPVIWYRRHQDRFELFRNDPPAWYTSHNHHLTHVSGASLNSWVAWKAGKTSAGAEFRNETIFSNVLGEVMDEQKNVPGEDALFTKSYSRNTWSGFLEHVYYHRKFTFSGGVLLNYISGRENRWKVFPGLETSVQLSNTLKIFSSFNTSLRMPTFTDLFYAGPTNIGNPDLKPEQSASLEGGVKISSPVVKGHGVVFFRKGKNIIDWTRENNSEVWQPQNLTQLNSLGWELNLQVNARRRFGRGFPDKLQVGWFTNKQTKNSPGLISNYVLDHIKNKVTGTVQYAFLKKFNTETRIVFQDREGTYTAFSDGNWGSEQEYRPFWLVDTRIGYSLGKMQVFVTVNNLMNRSYMDMGNVPQPGRWLKTGIIWNPGLK